ncbi:MAG: glycosyltransferase [Chloroflexi bacterium]|nr:glycosyltransferase [Chloroflexota bacterium]
MQAPAKVLWLIKGLGPGGAERLLVDSLPFLDRARFDYEVAYMLPAKDHFAPVFQKAGIPVFCLGFKSALDIGVFNRLVRLLKERKIELLHSHLPYAGVMGRFAGRRAGVKGHVYTEHNVLSAYHPFTALLDRVTYRRDDATIAVSDGVSRSALAWPLLRPKRLATIKNGVSLNGSSNGHADVEGIRRSLGIPANNILIGNVAHLRPQKGHVYLLEAMRKVVSERPDVSCVIIGGEKGNGTLTRLRRRARELSLDGHVVFTGFRQDARELMSAFDIFTLPSLYEGLPIALLEAMSLGKPSVVTAAGGVPEVVQDGVEGFVVRPGDSDALADRLLRLVVNEQVRKGQSIAAKKKVAERFGIDRLVREVEQIYTDILRRNGSTSHGL